MKKTVFFLMLLLLNVISSAQITREAIVADPAFAAGPYHPYKPGVLNDTKAPAGYRAFYINHIGRHGSRYLSDHEHDGTSVCARLSECGDRGLLTAIGKNLLEDCIRAKNAQSGHKAQISPLGAKEHREIAARMYRRFPSVWTDACRKNVYCKSSSVQRCILSMGNSTLELKGLNPSLNFTLDAFPATANAIRPDTSLFYLENRPSAARLAKWFEAAFDSETFGKRIFTDIPAAEAVCGNLGTLAIDVYNLWRDSFCVELDGFDSRKYFSVDELALLLRLTSDRWYEVFSAFADRRSPGFRTVDRLLEDVLTCGDAAVAGNGRCADLRYTHDSAIAPFLFKIGVEGCQRLWSVEEAYRHWDCTSKIPMAANVQFVFYAGKGGDVLVKLLLNEQETAIPALKPVCGPYYKWSDLRSIFIDILK